MRKIIDFLMRLFGRKHEWFKGPGQEKGRVERWLRVPCAEGARNFNFRKDFMDYDLVPAEGFSNDFGHWFKEPFNHVKVGGYTQYLGQQSGGYRFLVRCALNPSINGADETTGLHECGHVRLLPDIQGHPLRFKKCFPIWRFSIRPRSEEDDDLYLPEVASMVFDENGEVLYEESKEI